MSKWRPANSCIYVIPDIHGMKCELELILNRIIPLRKSEGNIDKLIFLGDYIDRRAASDSVLDLVMEIKEDQPDQVFCLKGNHEQLLLEASSPKATVHAYNMWMKNGGEHTFYGYLKRANSNVDNPYLIPRKNIDVYIPKEHMSFLLSLLPYYETNEYIFVHGGCDPFIPLNKQDPNTLIWDRSVYKNVTRMKEFNFNCPWSKTIVTGHNGETHGKPFIYDKFMMLDCSPVEKLIVLELNSRECFSARSGKNRLVKEPLI